MNPEKNNDRLPVDVTRIGSVVASWVFGGVLLLFLGAIVFLLPDPSPFQQAVIRVLVALAAGFLSFFSVGNVIFHGDLAGMAIGVVGGIALFILLVSVIDPFAIKTRIADFAPEVLRRDSAIARAQQILSACGLYHGRMTGTPDSGTRAAIGAFQRQQGLEANGYLGPATEQVLADMPACGDAADETDGERAPSGAELPTGTDFVASADSAILKNAAKSVTIKPGLKVAIPEVIMFRHGSSSGMELDVEISNLGPARMELLLMHRPPAVLVSNAGATYELSSESGVAICGRGIVGLPCSSLSGIDGVGLAEIPWTTIDPGVTQSAKFIFAGPATAKPGFLYSFTASLAYRTTRERFRKATINSRLVLQTPAE